MACRAIRTWRCGGESMPPECGPNWLARVYDYHSHLHGHGQVAVPVGRSTVPLSQMQTSPATGCRQTRGEPKPCCGVARRLHGLLARLSRLLSLQILCAASTCNNSPRCKSFSSGVAVRALQSTSGRDAEYKSKRCRVQVEVMRSTSCVAVSHNRISPGFAARFQKVHKFLFHAPSCGHIRIYRYFHVFAMARPTMSTRRSAGIAHFSTRPFRTLHGDFRNSLPRASLTPRCRRDENHRRVLGASA